MMSYEQLKLENQVCFPVYATSRLIIRKYQPMLDALGITYPQYLVLMVLWEEDGVSVQDITSKLILNTNTVTPLLKRMEKMEIITRERSKEDERKVLIYLTEKGKKMQEESVDIPTKLMEEFGDDEISQDELIQFKQTLHKIIGLLK